MRKLGLSQIVKNASEIKSVPERINYLRQHQSEPLKQLLQLGLSDVEWDLPEGAPPYKVSPYLDQEGMLYHETRRLYLFLKGGGRPDLNKVKREMLYIGILESIHPQDAELLVDIKDKKLPKTISKKVVEEAFPGLFGG